ncbi:MAG TPA: hypothetical protein VHC20_02950 [Candidatus Paceibacterota bacterium]|nr:hypothetical protein [Candidatus Paceibacterota bacterium]
MRKSALLIAAACFITGAAHAAPKVKVPVCDEFARLASAYRSLPNDIRDTRQRMQPHTFSQRLVDFDMRFTESEFRMRDKLSQLLHLGHARPSFNEAFALSYVQFADTVDATLSVYGLTAQSNALYASTMSRWCKEG